MILNVLHLQPRWTVFVALVIIALVVGCVIVFQRDRRSNRRCRCRPLDWRRLLSSPSPAASSTSVSECKWPSSIHADNGVSDAWSDFVNDRLSELDPRTNTDETKWALGVVDFLDELKDAEADASSEEQAESASLRTSLLAILSSKGFSLVDSDEWNPDKQRAVAVVRKPDTAEPKILGKGSTGLARDGKIIRKQEVKIEMKGN